MGNRVPTVVTSLRTTPNEGAESRHDYTAFWQLGTYTRKFNQLEALEQQAGREAASVAFQDQHNEDRNTLARVNELITHLRLAYQRPIIRSTLGLF